MGGSQRSRAQEVGHEFWLKHFFMAFLLPVSTCGYVCVVTLFVLSSPWATLPYPISTPCRPLRLIKVLRQNALSLPLSPSLCFPDFLCTFRWQWLRRRRRLWHEARIKAARAAKFPFSCFFAVVGQKFYELIPRNKASNMMENIQKHVPASQPASQVDCSREEQPEQSSITTA